MRESLPKCECGCVREHEQVCAVSVRGLGVCVVLCVTASECVLEQRLSETVLPSLRDSLVLTHNARPGSVMRAALFSWGRDRHSHSSCVAWGSRWGREVPGKPGALARGPCHPQSPAPPSVQTQGCVSLS